MTPLDSVPGATELLVWGIVVHLVVDWLLQNEYLAVNKVSLKHPAAYVHSGLHGAAQLLVFPWWAALGIGVTHLLIDTRKPVIWWSKLIRQTQPNLIVKNLSHGTYNPSNNAVMVDLGTEVRIWVDQVFHVAVVALFALGAAS